MAGIQDLYAALEADAKLSPEDKAKYLKDIQAAEYAPMAKSNFDIANFEQLLNRLEGSKMRQQRQKSTEGRQDIFAQGLASMMSNF